MDVTTKNPLSVPNTNWNVVTTGFAADIAVKNKHKKYDEVFRNHPGPFKPTFFAFAIETTGAWAKENMVFLDHLKAVAQQKLPSSDVEAFMNSLIRKIVLNHRKNVVQGILDVLDKHSNPFLPEQFMSLCDLDRVSRILEDA